MTQIENLVVPKLEVVVHAYNQGEFISQSIESVLMQQTDFPFRVVILEDCSSDNTRDIVKRTAECHPEKIDLRLHEQNICSNRPLMDILSSTEAKYIALLDGDDYWTSTNKLQRQVDFLEEHTDCSLCFHRAEIIYYDGSRPSSLKPANHPRFSTMRDLLRGNFIPTCAVVYRKSALDGIPAWYEGVLAADWYLHLHAAKSGMIGYIDDVMGVYRIHSNNLWAKHANASKWLQMIKIHTGMLPRFSASHYPIIFRAIVNDFRKLFRALVKFRSAEG